MRSLHSYPAYSANDAHDHHDHKVNNEKGDNKHMDNLWKFLTINRKLEIVSVNGSVDQVWDLYSRKEIPGVPVLCKSGYHASKTIADAAIYCNGPIIAKVSGGDAFVSQEGKFAFKSMRIVGAWIIPAEQLYTLVQEFAVELRGPGAAVPRRVSVGTINSDYKPLFSVNDNNYTLIEMLIKKLAYQNCYEVIGDIAYIAKAKGKTNFINEFFLNHVISERMLDEDSATESIEEYFGGDEFFLKD